MAAMGCDFKRSTQHFVGKQLFRAAEVDQNRWVATIPYRPPPIRASYSPLSKPFSVVIFAKSRSVQVARIIGGVDPSIQ